MLFDDVISRQRAAIAGFYADPHRSTMVLRVDPDLEFQAARFLALVGDAEDPERSDREAPIVFGASATFDEPAAYYREVAAQIHGSVLALRESYAPEDPDLVLPREAMPEPATTIDATAETRFAAYLEAIARGLGNWHDTVVFVLRFEAADARIAEASLRVLGGQLMTPGVKLVVLDDQRSPRLSRMRSLRTRHAASVFDPVRTDAGGRLARFLTSERERVLGLHCRGRDVRRLREELSAMPRRGIAVHVDWIEAPFGGAAHFGNTAYRSLRDDRPPDPPWLSPILADSPEFHAALRQPAPPERGDLPISIYDLRAIARPEQSFVELVQRVLDRRGQTRGCIVLQPTTVGDRAQWQGFVAALARACVGVDVKFIALDVDGHAPLADAPARQMPWVEHTFALEPERVHASIEAVLARTDLSADVRVAHLSMLANVRVGQGRHADAATLAAEAIELAERAGLRGALANAWWTLGYALQRAGDLEHGRNAFSEATDAALDEGNFIAAANALMGIGHTYFLERSWAAAVEAYELAREHWLDAGHVFGECQALIWCAEACRKAGQYPRAQERFAQAEARYRGMRSPFDAMATGGLADLYERMAATFADAGERSKADAYRQLARRHGSHGPVPDCPA